MQQRVREAQNRDKAKRSWNGGARATGPATLFPHTWPAESPQPPSHPVCVWRGWNGEGETRSGPVIDDVEGEQELGQATPRSIAARLRSCLYITRVDGAAERAIDDARAACANRTHGGALQEAVHSADRAHG